MHVITVAAFVLAVLANARLCRIASIDDIMLPFWKWAEPKIWPRLMQLSWCHWCSGVWTSLLLITPGLLALGAWHYRWPLWLPFALWLPVSLAVAYPSSRLVDSEDTSGPAA